MTDHLNDLVRHVLADLPDGTSIRVRLHTAEPGSDDDQSCGAGWPNQSTVTHASYWTAPQGGEQVVPVTDAAGFIVGWVPARNAAKPPAG